MIDEKGIQIVNHWNINETDFHIGCEKAHTVIIRSIRDVLQMADLKNHDYITVAEADSAVSKSVSPMLIIKRVNTLARWAANNIENDTLFNTSDTEYLNNDLAIDWLCHFIKCTHSKCRRQWILLIIDEFKFHMTLKFLNLATANNIVLFKLSPHSTHITQSLDVSVFQVYKSYHGQAIDHTVHCEDNKFDHIKFFTAFQAF